MHNIIFVGNPGVGKSTLLNSLLEHYDPENRHGRFKSGVSISHGLTDRLDKKEVNGIRFMDTPGLADVQLTQKASESIQQALQKDGDYQIFFVITLESGRVRPEDCATIKLVLESAPDITRFGIIFNKLSKNVMTKIQQDENNLKEYLVMLQPLEYRNSNKPPPFSLMLNNRSELEDCECVRITAPFEELLKFQRDVVHKINVRKEQVARIESDKFEKEKKRMENEMDQLRKDRNELNRMMTELQRRIKHEEISTGINVLNITRLSVSVEDGMISYGTGKVASVKIGKVASAEIRPNLDTGAKVHDDSVSASVAGMGVTLGRNIGVQTPLGKIKVRLW